LAFVRVLGLLYGDLFLLDLSDDLKPAAEPRRLTSIHSQIRNPAWSEDGESIVFSAGVWPHPSLWRVDVSGDSEPRRLPFAGDGVYDPAIAPQGDRLVFGRQLFDGNIWRQELVPGTGETVGSPVKWISSSRLDWLPSYSWDGKKIVFSSTRSGDYEIWVCESDGSSPLQLTDFGGPITGAPFFSPDDTRIVFDSRVEGQADLFIVNSQGGGRRRLTANSADDTPRVWSRDGKWIYFISRREDGSQLWKIPPDGGEDEAVRVTEDGARGVQESPDGRHLYFTKWRELGIWRMLPDGGEAVEVVSEFGWGEFGHVLVENGVYLRGGAPEGQRSLWFLNFETGKSVKIVEKSGKGGYGLALSPDGRFLLYGQIDHSGQDLMLVENFR